MADAPGTLLTALNPTIWSDMILHRLKINLVYGSSYVVNHDYEGEIQDYGDTVKIHGVSDPTIVSYTRDTTLGTPQVLTGYESILTIDQADAFNFAIDDVTAKQISPKVMGEAMDRAAYQLAVTTDKHVASLLVAAAGTTALDTANFTSPSVLGTTSLPQAVSVAAFSDPSTANTESAYEFLVDLGVALDQVAVPREGRYAIVPPWFCGVLAKDLRIIGYGGISGNTVLNDGFADVPGASGFAGSIAGFNVISSLDVPTGTYTTPSANSPYKAGTSQSDTYYKITCGVPSACTFANQIVKTETFRNPNFFADQVRGLHVYGAHVVWPERIAGAIIAKGV